MAKKFEINSQRKRQLLSSDQTFVPGLNVRSARTSAPMRGKRKRDLPLYCAAHLVARSRAPVMSTGADQRRLHVLYTDERGLE